MWITGALCLILLIASTLVHYETLRAMSYALPRLAIPARIKMVLVILGAFAGHMLEVLLYTLAYQWMLWEHGLGTLGQTRQPSFLTSIYFSATTYTSLGYGDVVPTGPLTLLAASEALIGLLLIGWTAAYVFISMERFWEAGNNHPAAGTAAITRNVLDERQASSTAPKAARQRDSRAARH